MVSGVGYEPTPTIVGQNLSQLLARPKLKKTSVKLSAYNGTEIPVSGKCLAKIKHKNTVTHVLFIAADTKSSLKEGSEKPLI